MALVEYARVSSIGQSLEVQQEKLQHCDKLFEEKKSGLNGKRSHLVACLDYIREGDWRRFMEIYQHIDLL